MASFMTGAAQQRAIAAAKARSAAASGPKNILWRAIDYVSAEERRAVVIAARNLFFFVVGVVAVRGAGHLVALDSWDHELAMPTPEMMGQQAAGAQGPAAPGSLPATL